MISAGIGVVRTLSRVPHPAQARQAAVQRAQRLCRGAPGGVPPEIPFRVLLGTRKRTQRHPLSVTQPIRPEASP